MPVNLGKGDEKLNDREVHVFCRHWGQDAPEDITDRVILEIGNSTAAAENRDLGQQTLAYLHR